jgi:hypothetical protein
LIEGFAAGGADFQQKILLIGAEEIDFGAAFRASRRAANET